MLYKLLLAIALLVVLHSNLGHGKEDANLLSRLRELLTKKETATTETKDGRSGRFREFNFKRRQGKISRHFGNTRRSSTIATRTIPQGDVQGVQEDTTFGPVDRFLGIPYGQPPVGQLRFSDPEPVKDFKGGEFDATNYGNTCIGYLDRSAGDFVGTDMWNAKTPLSEDCLNLNVWTPAGADSNKRLPVMVWIFGGGYFSGSSSLWVYDGKELAASQNVVVVSMNYRVGPFGFLSTGDGRISGNFGLKDQILALEWVQLFIRDFGGDPSRVTLFGESSGASSIGYFLLNPELHSLFHRAILESGAPNAHWAFMTPEQAAERTEKFATSVGCDPADRDLVECLRKVDAKSLDENQWVESHITFFPFVPTVDDVVVTDSPAFTMRTMDIDKDVLFGINKDEGSFWMIGGVLDGVAHDSSSPLSEQQYMDGVKQILWDLPESVQTQAAFVYYPEKPSGENFLQALNDIIGDRSFKCPTMAFASEAGIMAQYSNINAFFYSFRYRASNEVFHPWMGVIHGAEIQWIFGMPFNNSRGYNAFERDLSLAIMTYFGNFAKTGDVVKGDQTKLMINYWRVQGNRLAHLIVNEGGGFDFSHAPPSRRDFCGLWME